VNILGISAFYHDSAACLVQDGRVVAAAQEERFSRVKQDASFPRAAIDACLAHAGLDAGDLDLVVYYEKPLRKFERVLETFVDQAPRGFPEFVRAATGWAHPKLDVARTIRRGLGGRYTKRCLFLEHHESHAASAFYPSPFERAAILTLDGVGEWATGSIGLGDGARLSLLRETHFPHSIGLFYSALTALLGFRVNEGEYKLMGLAPYGEPRFAQALRENVVFLDDDGGVRLDLSYFAFQRSQRMTSPKLEALLGVAARTPDSPLEQRHLDVAASVQVVCEEAVLRAARAAHRLTGCSRLVMAGGVALNCVANGRLRREGPFEDIWVQPAAGDAGGALGAALFTWHQLLENPRTPDSRDGMQGALLGRAWSPDAAAGALDALGAVYTRFDDEALLLAAVAEELAAGRVVGHFAGRSEFGPRALGARSILGDPRSLRLRSDLNLAIKFRESFRPFAPAVLQEHAAAYFEMRPEDESPYMLFVANVHPDQRVVVPPGDEPPSRVDAWRVARSRIPAVTHVDHSARVQTVDATRAPRFHRLLTAFHRHTGCPVLINTSFNVRDEPIVESPADAYRCFMKTGMDILVVEDCLLRKSEQPAPT